MRPAPRLTVCGHQGRGARAALQDQPNLDLFQQAVDDLIVENDRVTGVVTQMGLRFHARAVVLTVGTFLVAASISAWKTTGVGVPATRRATHWRAA